MNSSMIALDPEKVKVFGEEGKKKTVPTAKCKLNGCDNTLTIYKGTGSKTLCEQHQRTQREYGGFARIDRKYTFWKKDFCECCGHKPIENIRLVKMPEPMKSVLAMRLLQVDHIVPGKSKKDRNDHPSNIQTLCGDCHQLKTLINGDF